MLLLLAALTSLASATTVSVPMADGVGLATDYFAPPGAGPWPTILRRTPYGRYFDPTVVQTLNDLGYAFVSQDVRGRGDSEGLYRPFFDDALDGAETVAWVASQPWSDGQMAMYGGSAESVVQFLAAGEGPAGLVALQPFQGTPDLRRSLYPGGAWREDLTTDWLASLDESQAEAALRENEVDSAFWDPVRLDEAELAQTEAAMLLVAGFFDIFEGEMVSLPEKLQASGSEAPVWLILGPWVHGGAAVAEQGEVRFSDAVYADFNLDLFTLYEWSLRGGPAPDWAPVRYAVSTFADSEATAHSVWVESDTWPPPSTLERLLLGEGGLGTASDGEPVELPVDPDDPVPSVGGGNLNSAAGVYDQAGVDARDDVFVASTAPREESVTIAGDLSATIWAASATTDADVIVRVEVIPPSGAAWLVADGIRRGRFVQGEDAIRPLSPGVPAAFEVDLGPMAVTLPPGHALRVAISGTLAPRYEPNPNLATPIADRPDPVPTTLTIYRDEAHPSSILVPVTAGTLGGVELDEEEPPVKDEGGCGCAAGAGSGGWGLLVLLALSRRRAGVGR